MEPVIYNNQVQILNAAGAAVIEPPTLASVQALLSQTGFDAKLDVALSTRVAEATFTNRLGEVQDSPTANTVLGRLKDIDDAISGTLTVAGTVTANLGTLNGAALDATLQSILTELNQKLEAGQTIVANIGTTGGLALDATLTGGTAKAIARGAAKGATAAGDLTGENVDANTQALHVILKGTQPTITVAGTVTANLGTLNGAALDATLQSILTELGQKTEPANNQNVVLAAAIPAGTNNIGDVDVASLPAVTQGTSPWVVGDGGSSLTVDAPVTAPVFVRLSDGTNPIATLPVSLASVPSHAVTNAGTFAVQVDGNALTSLQLIEDTVFTDDVAFTPGTSKVSAIGFMFDDVSPDAVDEGDIGIARINKLRAVGVGPLHTQTADLSNVNVIYDDSPTTASSQDVDCDGYAHFALSLTIDSTNTPTDIQLIIEFKDADGNYCIYQNGFWARLKIEDTEVATAKTFVWSSRDTGGIPPGMKTIRLRVVCTGTTASNTFEVTEAKIGLSTI